MTHEVTTDNANEVLEGRGGRGVMDYEFIAAILHDLRATWERTLDDPDRELADDLHFRARTFFADCFESADGDFDREAFLAEAGGA